MEEKELTPEKKTANKQRAPMNVRTVTERKTSVKATNHKDKMPNVQAELKVERESIKTPPKKRALQTKSGEGHSKADKAPDNEDLQPIIRVPEPPNNDYQNAKNKRNRNRNKSRGGQPENRDAQTTHHKPVDAKKLRKMAKALFMDEVKEEGLALMDDQITREAVKRAFRVAEIFLQEERRCVPQPVKEVEKNPQTEVIE